jgi:hypothetical protein
MIQHGFYIVKDDFFISMNDPYLKGNKAQNRPHYYCFKDTQEEYYWLIPLSSKIEKYKKLIEKRMLQNKDCDTLMIAKLDNGKESVFLIQDIFPITDEYIERPYTICGNHLRVTSEHLAKEIDKKAKKVINMLKKGVRFTPTQPNIIEIIKKLKS